MNLGTLVSAEQLKHIPGLQNPCSQEYAQAEAYARLFSNPVLHTLANLDNILSAPVLVFPLGWLAHVLTEGIETRRVSRTYTKEQIAATLADNGLFRTREDAMKEMKTVLSTEVSDGSFDHYEWRSEVDKKTKRVVGHYLVKVHPDVDFGASGN